MEFKSFSDFYPYYLREHSNITCRKLHFIGTAGVVALLLLFFFTGNLLVLAALPVVGYGFAWVGHFGFEKIVRPHSSIRFTAFLVTSECSGIFSLEKYQLFKSWHSSNCEVLISR